MGWRILFRFLPLLTLCLCGLAAAQEEGEEGCDGCSIIEVGGGAGGPSYELIEIDPFAEPPPEELEEPNRPEPIKVGEWEPPALTPEAAEERIALEAERSATPDDIHVRYRLAQFYTQHGWFEHAEAELHRCADLDRESIRPWESLIALYRRCLGAR